MKTSLKEIRFCTKCKKGKGLEDFYRNPRNGCTASWCRRCCADRQLVRNRDEGKKKRVFATVSGTKKLCLRCEKFKSLKFFVPLKGGSAGVTSKCRNCLKMINRERYDTKKNTEYAKSYRTLHREKFLAGARIRIYRRKKLKDVQSDGSVTEEFAISVYNNPFCFYCDNYTPRKLRTMDHFIPLSKGGLHSSTNIVMACWSCNTKKGSIEGDKFRKMHEHENITKRSRQSGD